MVRKKLDIRIKHLIENGVQLGHRSLFVVVGPKAKGQVILLHHMLRKSRNNAPDSSVLWCYKSKTFEVPRPLRRRKKLIAQRQNFKVGKYGENDEEFSMFLASTNIRYCFYRKVSDILGNTFEMLVLQDFDALTPNILAQTVETVQGGGLVVLLMENLESLQVLYDLCKHDVNTPKGQIDKSRCRFNERLLLSLTKCKMAMIIDDQLNIAPILPHVSKIEPVPLSDHEESLSENQKLLLKLQDSLQDKPLHQLINCCRTLDQANVVLKLAEAIQNQMLNKTVTITAARGRGKSAALGLAIAFAIKCNYSNILVTSPSPENLVTFFQFVVRGLESFGYKNKKDFYIIKSNDIKVNKSVVEIEVVKKHKQVVQYIHPSDCSKLMFNEIMVIDEAAAIPLGLIKNLMGPYLMFMSSTIHGYEGTGKSLALKFFQELRSQDNSSLSNRSLEELQLNETIRYKGNDSVESWLNKLLLLDASILPLPSRKLVVPSDCKFFYINREVLFNFSDISEKFLSQYMAIYTASNYKHSPNDLQLISDSDGHYLFCLTLPPDPNKPSKIPRIISVVHACAEGKLVKQSLLSEVNKGKISENNFVSWRLSKEYQHFKININDLGAVRIIQIATHPSCQGQGYGSHTLNLIENYFKNMSQSQNNSLLNKISKTLLIDPVHKPSTITVDFINANFGLNQKLLNFWEKSGFVPLYIGQNTNELTGDNTCFVAKATSGDRQWLVPLWSCFYRGFLSLLPGPFASMPTKLALKVLTCSPFPLDHQPTLNQVKVVLGNSLISLLTSHSQTLHLKCIMPLLQKIGWAFFLKAIPDMELEEKELHTLLGICLQHKSVSDLANELMFEPFHLQKMFVKILKTLVLKIFEKSYKDVIENHILENGRNDSSFNEDLTKFVNAQRDFTNLGMIRKSLKKELKSIDISPEIRELMLSITKTSQRAFVLVNGKNGINQLPTLGYHFETITQSKPSILCSLENFPKEDSQLSLFLSSYKVKLCKLDAIEEHQNESYTIVSLVMADHLELNSLAHGANLVKGGGMLMIFSNIKHLEELLNGSNENVGESIFTFRFCQLLPSLKNCLVLNDNLGVLCSTPLAPLANNEEDSEFSSFKELFQDIEPMGSLVNCTTNLAQANALKAIIDVLLDKSESSLIHVNGGQGNGKTALLGLATAYAVYFNYTNIFITSPNPQSLKTYFAFLIKGFLSIGFEEQKDFKVCQSTNPQLKGVIVRVEVYHKHRKTIQYVHPSDTSRLGLAELMLIDEASSLPLSSLNSLFGDYVTIMTTSTDGFGVAGCLRLVTLEKIIKENVHLDKDLSNLQNKKLTEVTLDQPILTNPNDPLKLWVNQLLSLKPAPLTSEPINPLFCKLYYISKQALFNGSSENENFLHKFMTIYHSGDYAFNVDEMRHLAENPDHHLFCLMPPFTTSFIPEPLCIIHSSFEGKSHNFIETSPNFCHIKKYFENMNSYIWIHKIVSHPFNQRRGYGTQALKLFMDYYKGDLSMNDALPKSDHLLIRLDQRTPEEATFIGTSFHLDKGIFAFWRKSGFKPIYIDKENVDNFSHFHPCTMIKSNLNWDKEQNASADFYHTFMNHLSNLKSLMPDVALSILESSCVNKPDLTKDILECWLSIDDLKCLEMNAINMVDYFVVAKYFTPLAQLYFTYTIDRAVLYQEQKVILLGLGLQHKSIEELEKETGIMQIKPLLNRTLRCLAINLKSLIEKEVKKMLPEQVCVFGPTRTEELAIDLQHASGNTDLGRYAKYAIKYEDSQWEAALKQNTSSLINIKAFYKRPREETSKNDRPPKKRKRTNNT